MVAKNPSKAVCKDVPNFGFKGTGGVNLENMIGFLHVSCTKDWIIKTSAPVNKLLSATFPQVGSYNEFFAFIPTVMLINLCYVATNFSLFYYVIEYYAAIHFQLGISCNTFENSLGCI